MSEISFDLESEVKQLEVIKRNFINAAAHELNTPLTISIGYLAQMLAERRADLPADLVPILELVYASNCRMAEITDDLQDIYEIDSETYCLEYSIIDFARLVRETQMSLEFLLLEHAVDLEVDIDDSLPEMVCDHGKLLKVVHHLLANAIRFSQRQDTVRLEAKCSYRAQCQYLHVQITNSGLGIPKSERARIFDSYFASPNIINRGTDPRGVHALGACLGLTISGKLIKLLDGRVWFDDHRCAESPDIGSIIHFELPISPDQEQFLEL